MTAGPLAGRDCICQSHLSIAFVIVAGRAYGRMKALPAGLLLNSIARKRLLAIELVFILIMTAIFPGDQS